MPAAASAPRPRRAAPPRRPSSAGRAQTLPGRVAAVEPAEIRHVPHAAFLQVAVAFDQPRHQHLVGEAVVERRARPRRATSASAPTARMRPSRTATCVASRLHRVHRDDLAGGVDGDRRHGRSWRDRALVSKLRGASRALRPECVQLERRSLAPKFSTKPSLTRSVNVQMVCGRQGIGSNRGRDVKVRVRRSRTQGKLASHMKKADEQLRRGHRRRRLGRRHCAGLRAAGRPQGARARTPEPASAGCGASCRPGRTSRSARPTGRWAICHCTARRSRTSWPTSRPGSSTSAWPTESG